MTATITPQDIALGVPTYTPVTGCRDVIPLCPTTFLHFYNDGAVDDVMVLTGANTGDAYDYPCLVTTLGAGEELIIGPFEIDAFYPEVLVSHSHPGDVTMAALFIAYESEGCDATISTVYPSIETTCTLVSTCPQLPDIAVIWPVESTSTDIWPLETAVVKVSACPQLTDSTVLWPDHTDFTVIWCGL